MSLKSQAKAQRSSCGIFRRRSILFSGFPCSPVHSLESLMEISTLTSLTELGMDHSFLHQWQMGSLDELCPLSLAAEFNENYYDMQLSSIPMFNDQEQPPSNLFETEFNRPSKLEKTNSWGSSITSELFDSTSPASADTLVPKSKYHNNVMKPTLEINFSSVSPGNSVNSQDNVINNPCRGTKRDRSVANAQAQDHVMAERRRREKLNQKFISLSALVPGLKRMDKASVLGDTINYLKTLQERVSNLEEKTKKQKSESAVFVEKHKLGGDDGYNNSSSSDEDFSVNAEAITKPLLEIEVRFAGKDALIRIHCEKRKGILDKVVAQVEKLPLSVINTSAMSFGSSVLDITVVAKMDEGFNMSIKDFVKNLDFQLQSLIGKYSKQEDTSLD